MNKKKRLSVEQLNAIDVLVQGRTDKETSDAVGVARETVTRWRNENSYFEEELNRLRNDICRSAHDRLRGLLPKALDCIDDAIEKGDVKAALAMLKEANLYGRVPAPTGERVDAEFRISDAKISDLSLAAIDVLLARRGWSFEIDDGDFTMPPDGKQKSKRD